MITNYIDTIFGYSLRQNAINYVDKIYQPDTSTIIKMMLFSFKDNNYSEIYNKLSELSVVHLIVVSGFHINVYVVIISFIFKKIKFLKNIILMIFLFFICYFNDFSLSIFRSLLFVVLGMFSKIDKKDYLNISILIISMFIPMALNKYGFQMSCLSVLILKIFNTKWKKESKIFNFILITLFINLSLLPYTTFFNNKISLLVLFYTYVLTPIFSFLYLFISCFFVFGFSPQPIDQVVYFFINIINICTSFNIFISLNKMSNVISIIYISLFLLLFNYWKEIKYEINKIIYKKI